MQIGARAIGPGAPVYIIAELSANHEQEFARAEALIYAAAMAGASAVKVQTFTADELAAEDVLLPQGYDLDHDRWLLSLGIEEFKGLFTKGGLPRAWHEILRLRASMLGLDFLSTPFSVDAARFLVDEIQVPALKIASGDLTFGPLLDFANTTSLPVILSTGGATMAEVDTAVAEHLWQTYTNGRLVLLHCVSHYPMRPEEANLRAIRTLGERYAKAVVGWSDHSLSAELIPAFAVREGACVVEKHLTWERDAGRVDAGHSLTPHEFAAMVRAIRAVPQILGDGSKRPQLSEGHDRLWARRGPDGLRPTAPARAGQWQ